ncbi:MAG: helix-turn-helix domain-containing protein, partial [Rhodospirillaceae bacterium]
PLLTVNLIRDMTADWFSCPRDLIRSHRRAARFARPRQVAMWISVQLLPCRSLPRIGRDFDRDHTTVIYAVNMVEKRRRDADYAADLDALMQSIVDASEPPSGPAELALRVAEDMADAYRFAAFTAAAADPFGFLERFADKEGRPHA